MVDNAEIFYQQLEGLDVHETDDGLIVFNPQKDRVHHLNSSAGVLFELCAQPRSRQALINSFNTLFELSADEAAESALDQMTKEGVLVESKAP